MRADEINDHTSCFRHGGHCPVIEGGLVSRIKFLFRITDEDDDCVVCPHKGLTKMYLVTVYWVKNVLFSSFLICEV